MTESRPTKDLIPSFKTTALSLIVLLYHIGGTNARVNLQKGEPMDREQAKNEIRSRWKELYSADKKGKGIVCPLCGNGSGKDGDGIRENPKSRIRGGLICFKCGFKGDVFDLIQQEQGVTFHESLKIAAESLGIVLDSYQDQSDTGILNRVPEPARPPQSIPTDYTEELRQYQAQLQGAIPYLQARGISFETASAYGLGYAPEWRSPTALRSGKNPPSSPRLIVPTCQHHYIARDTRIELTPNQAKFSKMNEGTPEIFNQSVLYDRNKDKIFVVEGAIDALSLIECGADAIALNSTSNAERLIERLQERPTRSILLLALDNDDGGRRALKTLTAGLQRLNISYVTVDICGRYKDPNEALTSDKSSFIGLIKQAESQASAKPDSVKSYIDLLMGGEIEEFQAAKERRTGFSNLDAESGGLYAGLYCVAATSSLGKTTFCHQMADQLAMMGEDVIFFSMEQSRLELVSKSIARMTAQQNMASAVTSLSIRKGYLPVYVQKAALEYRNAVSDRFSIVEGNFNCNISFIGNYVRQYVQRTGCKPVVFVDYLQILQPSDENKGQSTKETVDSTVTELKRISRELNLTIFVISSVNRMNYLTPIDFESLKESGGIEYTCDVIYGLQLQCLNSDLFSNQMAKIKEKRKKIREEKARNPRKIELVCLKNRYGIANFSCYFDYYPANDLFVAGSPEQDYISDEIDNVTGGKI